MQARFLGLVTGVPAFALVAGIVIGTVARDLAADADAPALSVAEVVTQRANAERGDRRAFPPPADARAKPRLT
jgi:hypothetical protein